LVGSCLSVAVSVTVEHELHMKEARLLYTYEIRVSLFCSLLCRALHNRAGERTEQEEVQ